MKKLLTLFLIIIAAICLAAVLPACGKEQEEENPLSYFFSSEEAYNGNQTEYSYSYSNTKLYVGKAAYFIVDYKMPAGEDSETYTLKVSISSVQTVRARIEYAGSKTSHEETVDNTTIMTADFTPYDKPRDVRLIVILTPIKDSSITCKGEVLHNGEATEYSFNKNATVYKSAEEGSGLNYKLNDDKQSYSVSGIGKEKGEYVYVPEIYEGLPVTAIADRAFYDCTTALEIHLPESIKSIGNHAFYGCSKISSIDIPQSVEEIGDGVFSNCFNLKININENNPRFKTIDGNLYSADGKILMQYVNKTGRTSFTVPDDVERICMYAFKKCSLTSLTLSFVGETKDGTGNTCFGYIFGASSYSSNKSDVPKTLTDVTVTGGSIGEDAFRGCASLKNITIADSVTSVGSCAFVDCPIETAIVPARAIYYIKNKALKSITITSGEAISSYAFRDCTLLESVTIADSVTSIGERAFANCKALTSITIPDSVESMGEKVFEYCSSLESITLPFVGATKNGTENTRFSYLCIYTSSLKSVTITCAESIGESAFYNCSSLTSVSILDGVTSIGDSAFSGCSKLENISVPDSVTSIGDYAFYNCTSLVYNEYGNAKYLGNSTNPCVILVESKDKNITSCTINGNTKYIYKSAFSGCKMLASVTIPDRVISIGENAFYECSNLESIIIPDSVTSIGLRAFYNCPIKSATLPAFALKYIQRSLKSVIITSGESIVKYAFWGYSSITSITIPNSVTSIGEDAFYNCSKLTSITFNGTKAQWNAIEKGSGWNAYTGNYVIHCTDGDISK